MLKLILFCLAVSQIQIISSQCMNRPPMLFNMPEAIETPFNALALQPTVFEPPSLLSPSIPSPTTIVTDCSPEVCKNLANTIQLMIVSNLIKNTKGGSDLAAQLVSPIIGEFLSSAAFSCPCAERPFLNPVPPLITPGISPVTPGLIGPGAVFSNPGIGVNCNPLLGNILGILGR